MPDNENGQVEQTVQTKEDLFKAAFEGTMGEQSTVEPAQEPAPEQQPEAQESEPTQQTVDQTSEPPANQAFAQMRVENKNLKSQNDKMFAYIQKQGYKSFDDFNEAMEKQAIQESAEKNGVTPEVEKRLQALEAENLRYRREERTRQIQSESRNVINKYGISEAEWKTFCDTVEQNNIDLDNSNVSIETLYMQFNGKSIIDRAVAKAVEQAKQEWMQSQNHVQQTAPTVATQSSGGVVLNNDKSDYDIAKRMAQSYRRN